MAAADRAEELCRAWVAMKTQQRELPFLFRELIDKTPKVVPESDWQVHYVFFARAGFTEAALEEVQTVGAQLVDLNKLDQDLK